MNKSTTRLLQIERQLGKIEGIIQTLPKESKEQLKQLQSEVKTLESEREKLNKLQELHDEAEKSGAINPSLTADFALANNLDPYIPANELIAKMKAAPDTSFMFEAVKTGTIPRTSNTKNPFRKESFNMTEQLKLISSNPALAEQLRLESQVVQYGD